MPIAFRSNHDNNYDWVPRFIQHHYQCNSELKPLSRTHGLLMKSWLWRERGFRNRHLRRGNLSKIVRLRRSLWIKLFLSAVFLVCLNYWMDLVTDSWSAAGENFEDLKSTYRHSLKDPWGSHCLPDLILGGWSLVESWYFLKEEGVCSKLHCFWRFGMGQMFLKNQKKTIKKNPEISKISRISKIISGKPVGRAGVTM